MAGADSGLAAWAWAWAACLPVAGIHLPGTRLGLRGEGGLQGRPSLGPGNLAGSCPYPGAAPVVAQILLNRVYPAQGLPGLQQGLCQVAALGAQGLQDLLNLLHPQDLISLGVLLRQDWAPCGTRCSWWWHCWAP